MLIDAGCVPPRVHDLGVVLDAVERSIPGPEWAALRDAAEGLSDFSVGPRYPGWDWMTDGVDLDAVLDAARAVLRAVEHHLASRRDVRTP